MSLRASLVIQVKALFRLGGEVRSDVRVHGADSSKLRAGFQVACSVSADLRAAFEAARPRMGSQGQTFRDVSVSHPRSLKPLYHVLIFL
jgi:hypothetical protein